MTDECYWCDCGAELHETPSYSTSCRSGRFECDVCHAVYYLYMRRLARITIDWQGICHNSLAALLETYYD